MSYVFDTSPLSALFKNYYRKTFRSLWEHFDGLVANGSIVSTREALREIQRSPIPDLIEWAKANPNLFAMPTPDEGAFVASVYGVVHFQQNIEQQKLLQGGLNADPFIVAKAAIDGGTVVTMEVLKPQAARIPNICQHFGVACISLEEFMVKEEWEF